MNHPIIFLIPVLFIGLFWISELPVPKSPAVINAEFEAYFTDSLNNPTVEYVKDIIEKTGKPPVINKQFIDQMNSVLPKETVASRTQELQELSQFRYGRLTPCNQFRALGLKSKLSDQLNVLTIEELKTADSADNNAPTDGTSIHQRRYMNKIRGYSGLNLTIEELIEYGENEVVKSRNALLTLENEIAEKGLASSLNEFQANFVKSFTNENEIIEAFELRRPIIEKNLSKLFLEYDLPPTKISASQRLDFVYAIGTYSARRNTFHFYWDGETFLDKHLDYLMLHELVPGHHLQAVLLRRAKRCTGAKLPAVPRSRYTRSFMEGWATYIESFGPELGLFQTFEQQLGILDWQLIRSHRVILDARLHHDNWSWDQFESYWTDYLPERLHELAEREYNRLRKMPLQTQAYKFGADAIMRLRKKEETRLGDDFDIRKFHDKLLRMGQVPLDILDESYAALP